MEPGFQLSYSMSFNSVKFLNFTVKDDEGQNVAITLDPMSSFLSLISNQITMHPTEPS